MEDQVESPQSLTTVICCQNFIETLNKVLLIEKEDNNEQNSDETSDKVKSDPNISENCLTPDDILSFMSYCQTWQQK